MTKNTENSNPPSSNTQTRKSPLSLLGDYVFKRTMQDAVILSDFLQATLNLPIFPEDIAYTPTEMVAEKKDDKRGILDVKIKTPHLGLMDIEAQATYHSYLWSRFFYYTVRMYSQQLNSGDNYKLLRPAKGLFILGAKMVPDENCYHRFRFIDDLHGYRYNKNPVEIHLFEITKRNHLLQENLPFNIDRLYNWMQFFAATNEEEYMQAAHDNAAMNRAWNMIDSISQNDLERETAESLEKARREEAAFYDNGYEDGLEYGYDKGREEGRKEGRKEGREEGRKEGREEGREQGREEGRKEGREEGREEGYDEGIEENRREIICNMLDMGLTPTQISLYTKTPLSKIEEYSANI